MLLVKAMSFSSRPQPYYPHCGVSEVDGKAIRSFLSQYSREETWEVKIQQGCKAKFSSLGKSHRTGHLCTFYCFTQLLMIGQLSKARRQLGSLTENLPKPEIFLHTCTMLFQAELRWLLFQIPGSWKKHNPPLLILPFQ